MGFLQVLAAGAGRAAATADEARQTEEMRTLILTIFAVEVEMRSYVFQIVRRRSLEVPGDL